MIMTIQKGITHYLTKCSCMTIYLRRQDLRIACSMYSCWLLDKLVELSIHDAAPGWLAYVSAMGFKISCRCQQDTGSAKPPNWLK